MPHFGTPPIFDPPVHFLALNLDETIDLGLASGVASLRPTVSDPSVAEVSDEASVHEDLLTFRLTAVKVGATQLQAKNAAGDVVASAEIKVEVPPPATPDDFIARIAADGADIAREFHLPVCLMIAMACLESKYGRSGHAMSHNVLYGITKRKELTQKKEFDWYPTCRTIAKLPTIAIAGQSAIMDFFCSATSYAQAVRIWAEYVTGHPHTKSIQKLFAADKTSWTDAEVKQLADHMHSALRFGMGEKDYGATVMKVIAQYDLRKYDAK